VTINALRWAVLLAPLVCLHGHGQGPAPAEKHVRVRGFVMAVTSPREFTLDDGRITEAQRYHVFTDAAVERLRIGANLEVEGAFNSATSNLRASAVTPRTDSFQRIRQTTVLSRVLAPGVFQADGRRVRLDASTKLIFEKDEAGITTLDAVRAGTVMTYSASRHDADGTVVADHAEFRRNDRGTAERGYLKDLDVKITMPDYDRRREGSVRFLRRNYFGIVANAQAQRFIGDLGWNLVPEYQRALAADDPDRIPFQFFIVKQHDLGASSLPTGVVMIYSEVFEALDNVAQLAAILGHEIAHVTQEHSWLLSNNVGGELGTQFGRAYEDQADRISLEYMTNAGYDPREAARLWKLFTKRTGLHANLAGVHKNQALRYDSVMNILEQNYQDLDYTHLVRDEARYNEIARLVKHAVDPNWTEPQSK